MNIQMNVPALLLKKKRCLTFNVGTFVKINWPCTCWFICGICWSTLFFSLISMIISPLFCYFREFYWPSSVEPIWYSWINSTSLLYIILFFCGWTHFANIWLRTLAKSIFLMDISLQFSFLMIHLSRPVILLFTSRP